VDRPGLRLAEDARISVLVGFTLAAIAVVLANTDVPRGQNGGVGPLVVGIVLSGVVALAVGILVFSRARRPGRAGLVVGILGVLTVVAFWSGLPFVLGAHAVALARRARGGLATTGLLLGGLAVIAAGAATVIDRF
jgi:ABC-type transport system involved in multi-copper enzyme maturation permease subunit